MSGKGTLTAASTLMVVNWLEQRQGASVVDTLFDRLNTVRGHAVSRAELKPRGKVDYRIHTDLLEEVASLTNADDETLRDIGRDGAANVEMAVPGAGLMLRMATPKRLLKHAGKLWHTYADFGDVEVLEVENGRARLRIHGFDTHAHFCRTLEGFFEALIGRVGGSEVRVRELTHEAGADGCVFEGTWS